MCWGYGYYGQLGNGSSSSQIVPTPVSGLSSGVAALAAGQTHTCALTTQGGVLCWGDNEMGQLGDGTRTERLEPVPVSGLASGVAAISAGQWHTCALLLDGSMRCWGYNADGRLGDGTYTDRLVPAVVSGIAGGVSRIYALPANTCVVMTNGTVQCWGDDHDGQLGDGSVLQSAVPLPVVGFESAPQVPLFGAPAALLLAATLMAMGCARLRHLA